MKRHLRIGLLAAFATCANAAQIYTETFPANFSGWSGNVQLGVGFWSWSSGRLQVDFDPLDPPFSVISYLIATNTSSSGRFTGNWATSGVDAVGFDLTTIAYQPGGVRIKLYGSTNNFTKALNPPQPGVTESFLIGATTASGDGWNGVPNNSDGAFASVKTNVLWLQIEVDNEFTTNAQTYRVDNIFLAQTFQWDGGAAGTGAFWHSSASWYPDGIPGANSRVIIASTGSAEVIGIDSSQATGGVLQIGQLFCSVSNRTFENVATTNDSKIQFNGYSGIFLDAGSNNVAFRDGAVRKLELVANRYRGEFNVDGGGSIVISNSVISETNQACRIEKSGAGLMHMGASNKYTGGTLIRAGTLRIGHTNSLGSGGLTINHGKLDLNGMSITVPFLAGATGAVSDSSSGISTTVLTIAQSTNTAVFGGGLSNGADKIIALVKNGTGTLFIAGTNLNSGLTSLNVGTLLMQPFEGSSGSNKWPVAALGAGGVNVATGTVFGGVGIVNGPVVSGGTVRPGFPTGVLVCASSYTQTTNGLVQFVIGGTNAAQNFHQLVTVTTTSVYTNVVGGVTNVSAVTNNFLSTVSNLYNRLQVSNEAALAGTLRISLTNGFAPTNGNRFQIISCGLLSGAFATNTYATNNLPSPGAGREWHILYSSTGVTLVVTTSGPPSVFVTDARVIEGNAGTANLRFGVMLSRPYTAAVSVVFASSNLTAAAGADYSATNGLLVIPAGACTGSIVVAVNGDSVFEYDETLQMNLTGATNATIALGQATGTILNDDTVPGASISGLSQNEGNGETNLFLFPVILSAAAGAPVFIDFSTSNLTAIAGTHYLATNGTLAIPSGAITGLVSVSVLGNNEYDTGKSFQITLVSAVNATITSNAAIGEILNDDPLPAVNISGVSQSEGDTGVRQFVFPITATSSALAMSFDFSTTNGTAVAGLDYTPTNGTIILPPGAGSTSVTVIVICNTYAQGNRNFLLNLSNPSNCNIETASANGNILDDDFVLYTGYYYFSLQIPDVEQRGHNADPDGDGYVNVLEYITGGDPTNADTIAAVTLLWTNGTASLSFNRNTNSTEMIIYVDHANDIGEGGPWTGIATNQYGNWNGLASETGTSTPVAVTVQDPDNGTNRFLRLRAIIP